MVENKYYERKIKYLNLMENGVRTGGAGFIKTEVQGMDISFTVIVKGLHPTDTYERDVMLQAGDGEFAVGRIVLKEGQGQFMYRTVMDYSQIQGIRIALGGAREIQCKWQEEKRTSTAKRRVEQDSVEQDNVTSADMPDPMEEEKQRKEKKSPEIQMIPWDEIKAVEESLEKTEKIMSKSTEGETWKAESAAKRISERKATERETVERGAAAGETAEKRTATGETAERGTAARKTAVRELVAKEMVKEAADRSVVTAQITTGQTAGKLKRTTDNSLKSGGRNLGTANETAGRGRERQEERSGQRSIPGSSLGRDKKPVRLMEDKWQQIWAIYPHIHPFQDEREYLSISPADFVLLPDEAYRAANNSFLLHGYYNYDHLILTKIEKRGEVLYYIGVPGNYYEREKQVAVMFGFESFECGTEPAQAGDFGYYMMRTQL